MRTLEDIDDLEYKIGTFNFSPEQFKSKALKLAFESGKVVTVRQYSSGYTLTLGNGLVLKLPNEVLFPQQNFFDVTQEEEEFFDGAFLKSALLALPQHCRWRHEEDRLFFTTSEPCLVEFVDVVDHRSALAFGNRQEFTPEVKEVRLESYQTMTLFMDEAVVGYIDKLPNKDHEYIVRNESREKVGSFKAGGRFYFPNQEHPICSLEARGPILRLQGEKGHFFQVFSQRSFEQSKQGENYDYRGFMNGGRFFRLKTTRELGLSRYKVNEDSVGFNIKKGRLGGADGIGGYKDGEHAAFLGLKTILEDERSLSEAVTRASNFLYFFNRPNLKAGREGADTLVGMVEFAGDRFEALTFGDNRWALIRDKEIYEHSFNDACISEDKGYSLREVLTHKQRHKVASSLMDTPPRVFSMFMKPGDILVMYDDGIGLTQTEILAIFNNTFSPDKAFTLLLDITRARNTAGSYTVQDEQGEFTVDAPQDNAFLIVYVHD